MYYLDAISHIPMGSSYSAYAENGTSLHEQCRSRSHVGEYCYSSSRIPLGSKGYYLKSLSPASAGAEALKPNTSFHPTLVQMLCCCRLKFLPSRSVYCSMMILLGLGSRDCTRSTQMHGQTGKKCVLAATKAISTIAIALINHRNR